MKYDDLVVVRQSSDGMVISVIMFPDTERALHLRTLSRKHAGEIKAAIEEAFNEGLKYEITPRAVLYNR